MKWINFLHIYQPPTQQREVIDQVTKESYFLILDLLGKFPDLRLTMNISGSLLELLEKDGYNDVIAGFRKYVDEGRIELVGSAMYHPILPLIPYEEIKAQIELNSIICRKFFGDGFKPTGFYFPEMAYSAASAKAVKEAGFEWIILDDAHAPAEIKNGQIVKADRSYTIKDVGLDVIFRNNIASRTFPPEYLFTQFDQKSMPYLITAHDGELYGHWHKNDNGFYHKAFTSKDTPMLTVSEYLWELRESERKNGTGSIIIEPRSGSWESTDAELAAGIPYALWNDPENMIHVGLWDLVQFIYSALNNALSDKHHPLATMYFHRGLASCAWWWASERQLGPFSPLTWNPEEIEKGATELMHAIRSLDSLPISLKNEAETKFGTLRTMIWTHHWKVHGK